MSFNRRIAVSRTKSAALGMLGALLLLSACAGFRSGPVESAAGRWSSADPLTIPIAARRAQYEKGNLIANPSFEDGRRLGSRTSASFELAQWEIVGNHVEWVDTQAEHYDASEAIDGRHAVKITREKAGELDEAEGVLSSFIPVIPGNYDFFYEIKLKNIFNNRYRLGVRLFDAVVVRVFFFDARKKPIEPGIVNPVSGRIIDNSDKSYSFSNYWAIEEFPWGKVRARSYNYPFSEGDVPEGTRFVRLFLGLKGMGTMWVDRVVYRYSKWNFTTLERFEPLFDHRLSLKDRIIPTPKKFEWVTDINYCAVAESIGRPPVIVLPENPDAAERTAAEILRRKISTALSLSGTVPNAVGSEVKVLEGEPASGELSGPKLIFSIGRNQLYHAFGPDLALQTVRDKAQGYVISAATYGTARIVFLIGETPLGTFNAAATAVQLLEERQCVYHDAAVIDYPDFLGRSYQFKNWRNADELQDDLGHMERMSLLKLNKVYTGYDRTNADWYRPDGLFSEGVQAAGRICKKSGVMSLAVMVNPYSHFPMGASVDDLDASTRRIWTHADSQSLERLKGFFEIGLQAGASTIMLLSDDFVPHAGNNYYHYSLYTKDDQARFVNLQNAQAHVINSLKQWIDKAYPGTRFEFCPPWYANEFIDHSHGRAEVYLRELTEQISKDIAIIWTGPTVRSLSVDMADLYRFHAHIGRWPMTWDNTLYARNLEARVYGGYPTYYPGKVRMCNLFEPFDTYRPEGFHEYSHDRHLYTNGDASSEIYRIKYATVADYEWNTAAYDPERSLWKVLCNAFGPSAAREMIIFNDAYYTLYQVCRRIESAGEEQAMRQEGKMAVGALDRCLRRISAELPPGHRLNGELEKLRDRQVVRFEKALQEDSGRE